ncbi:MAG: hypothetical protein ABW032_03285 [Burkholderiaceae bacterium]
MVATRWREPRRTRARPIRRGRQAFGPSPMKRAGGAQTFRSVEIAAAPSTMPPVTRRQTIPPESGGGVADAGPTSNLRRSPRFPTREQARPPKRALNALLGELPQRTAKRTRAVRSHDAASTPPPKGASKDGAAEFDFFHYRNFGVGTDDWRGSWFRSTGGKIGDSVFKPLDIDAPRPDVRHRNLRLARPEPDRQGLLWADRRAGQ